MLTPLQDNPIGEEGVVSLARALEGNNSITTLGLAVWRRRGRRREEGRRERREEGGGKMCEESTWRREW